MALKPIHDWVLLRRDRSEERTPGGIIIPASATSEPSRGVVEAIGPGKYKKESGRKEERFVPTILKPGQWVFFPGYAARDVELNGEKITLIREEDILGTFEGRPKSLEEHPRAEIRKEQPSSEMKAAGRVEGVRVKKTVVKTKPQKAAKRTSAPKKKEKTAPAKKTGEKKVKTKKTAAKKTSERSVRKKTPGRVKKTTSKKTPARKTTTKKTAAKKKKTQKRR